MRGDKPGKIVHS